MAFPMDYSFYQTFMATMLNTNFADFNNIFPSQAPIGRVEEFPMDFQMQDFTQAPVDYTEDVSKDFQIQDCQQAPIPLTHNQDTTHGAVPLDKAQNTSIMPRYPCLFPGCGKTFPQKKTLTRHVRTLHGPSVFKCSHRCGLQFKRNDIRLRHEVEQHGTGRDVVRCTACRKDIQIRAIEDHWKTQTHRKAEVLEDQKTYRDLTSGLKKCPSDLRVVEATVDPVLISAFLIVRATQAQENICDWALLPREMLELKGLAMRAFMQAVPLSPTSWTGRDIQAVCAIMAFDVFFVHEHLDDTERFRLWFETPYWNMLEQLRESNSIRSWFARLLKDIPDKFQTWKDRLLAISEDQCGSGWDDDIDDILDSIDEDLGGAITEDSITQRDLEKRAVRTTTGIVILILSAFLEGLMK